MSDSWIDERAAEGCEGCKSHAPYGLQLPNTSTKPDPGRQGLPTACSYAKGYSSSTKPILKCDSLGKYRKNRVRNLLVRVRCQQKWAVDMGACPRERTLRDRLRWESVADACR